MVPNAQQPMPTGDGPRRLKVGLLVSSLNVTPENYDLASWAANSPWIDASVILMGIPAAVAPSATPSRAVIARANRFARRDHKPLAMHLSMNLGKLLRAKLGAGVGPTPAPAGASDVSEVLPIAHHFVAEVSPSGFVHRLTSSDAEQLRESRYDVLLRLGNGILRGDILTASQFGILSFHHGDNRVNRGGPWGYWEVFNREASTGFVLQRLTEELDGGEVLVRRNHMTLGRVMDNRQKLIARSYPILKQVISELAQTRQLPEPEPALPYAGPLYRTPTVAQSIRFGARQVSGVVGSIRRKLLKATGPVWKVGVIRGDWQSVSLRSKVSVAAAPGTWLADPFVVAWEGQTLLFVEEYVENQRRGRISCLALGPKGAVGAPVPVLEEPFHLSFPWCFEYQGTLYMVPETYDARQVRLYRCNAFPSSWSLDKVIFDDVQAVDPMIFEHAGCWYLLMNLDSLNGSDPNSELHAYWSTDPTTGRWNPIPGNPQVADPREARNGGLLRAGDRLFRVGQRQGFAQYGEACSLFEITKLGPDGYREQKVLTLEAGWAPKLLGPHHLASAHGWTVFDYLEKMPRSRKSRG